MKALRGLFENINMTWLKVALLAIAAATFTAAVMVIDKLKDTSLQDIGISLECWILLALIIILNCDSVKEACLKCFVFFLISQPLIYLLQVPFSPEGLGIFHYYRFWGMMTILTIPGAAIAYQLKKKNWLSVLILAVPIGFLGWTGIEYAFSARFSFPDHLISMVFCILLAVFLIFVLFSRKSHRMVLIAFLVLVMAGTGYYHGLSTCAEISLGEGTWDYAVKDGSILTVEIQDGTAEIRSAKDGNTDILFSSSEGEEKEYNVSVSGGGIFVTSYEE